MMEILPLDRKSLPGCKVISAPVLFLTASTAMFPRENPENRCSLMQFYQDKQRNTVKVFFIAMADCQGSIPLSYIVLTSLINDLSD